jgi:hypothetical protein
VKAVARAVVVVGWLAGAVLACGKDRDADFAVGNRAAIAVWHEHEIAIQRVLDGYVYSDEFDRACRFFAETTGLPSGEAKTFFGRMAGDDLAGDLEHWREWYRQHQSDMYLEPNTGQIKLRTERKGTTNGKVTG